jgi:hypothetical protein
MGGHALRGAVTAWLGLIVLQAVVSTGGSGRVAGAFTGIAGLVNRALDPNVPAIPDRRAGATDGPPGWGQPTPEQVREAVAAAANAPAVAGVFGPNGGLPNLGSLQQYTSGGGLPPGFLSNPALQPH